MARFPHFCIGSRGDGPSGKGGFRACAALPLAGSGWACATFRRCPSGEQHHPVRGRTAARARQRISGGESWPDARGTLPVAVAAGWRSVLGSLRAVYRVDLIVEQPSGSWRVFVDAETGRALFRESLRYSVAERGNVYSVSPAETSDSLCPLSGT